MDFVVPADGRVTEFTAHRCVRASSEPGRTLIDLRKASWVDPFGIATVAGLLEHGARRGDEIHVRGPELPDVASYLSRMHLGDAIETAGTGCPLPSIRERAVGDRLLPLGRFDGDDAAEELAERVFNIFRAEDGAGARALFRCVSEAAANVCEHSGLSHGWAVLQQYQYRGFTVVAFAVADTGMGLRRSLSRRHDVDTDSAAVRLAVRPGVTSTRTHNRGLGLDGIIQQARARHGAVRLWSGRGTGVTGAQVGQITVRRTTSRFPGTIAHARLAKT